eukprot:768582-Hanusia_phi.AAC.5
MAREMKRKEGQKTFQLQFHLAPSFLPPLTILASATISLPSLLLVISSNSAIVSAGSTMSQRRIKAAGSRTFRSSA